MSVLYVITDTTYVCGVFLLQQWCVTYKRVTSQKMCRLHSTCDEFEAALKRVVAKRGANVYRLDVPESRRTACRSGATSFVQITASSTSSNRSSRRFPSWHARRQLRIACRQTSSTLFASGVAPSLEPARTDKICDTPFVSNLQGPFRGLHVKPPR